jgi:hypothetical protein
LISTKTWSSKLVHALGHELSFVQSGEALASDASAEGLASALASAFASGLAATGLASTGLAESAASPLLESTAPASGALPPSAPASCTLPASLPASADETFETLTEIERDAVLPEVSVAVARRVCPPFATTVVSIEALQALAPLARMDEPSSS